VLSVSISRITDNEYDLRIRDKILEINRNVIPPSAKAIFGTAPGRLMREVYETL
jgi:hypothetical protein